MASSNILTYDQTPPHRPGIDEVGGGQKENDAEYPPDPALMPTAEDFNQIGRQIVALGKVGRTVILSVRFSSGDPVIEQVQATSSAIVASTFTLTDDGDGNTRIEWAAGTFPAAIARPSGLTINADIEIDRLRAIPITNGVRVITKLGTTGVDADFTLELN